MKKRYWLIGGIILYALAQGTSPPDSLPPSSPRPTLRSPTYEAPRDPQSPKAAANDPASASPSSEPDKEPEPPTSISGPSVDYPTRFLSGNRVAFRAGPSTGDAIIDRFDKGRRVLLLDERDEWSQVRDELTQREGWMASRFIRDEPPQREAERPQSLPGLSEATIIERIIAESVASYPSSCACPYNRDRGGRRCGRRSAYSKPGGYSPICFPGDVTRSMIEAFRQRH